jgi:hypothetical protein
MRPVYHRIHTQAESMEMAVNLISIACHLFCCPDEGLPDADHAEYGPGSHIYELGLYVEELSRVLTPEERVACHKLMDKVRAVVLTD